MRSDTPSNAAREHDTEQEIISLIEDGVMTIRLNRPAAMNSLTPEMLDGLDAALAEVEASSAVFALVITGAGRPFCAGADLNRVEQFGALSGLPADEALGVFLERAGAVFNRLERLSVPTYAALNGITLAGGLEVALCCDIIVADEAARIGDGHAKYAMLPGGGGTVRLARRIGAARAKQIMFSASMFSAEQCKSWGLVEELAPEGQVQQCVSDLLKPIRSKSKLGLARMKQLVNASLDVDLETALKAELAMCKEHALSHDRNEGLAAFAAKREPIFKGC